MCVRSREACRKGKACKSVDGKCSKINIVLFSESSAKKADSELEVASTAAPADVSLTAVTSNKTLDAVE